MTPRELETCRSLAYTIERACDQTGNERKYSAMRETIAKQEREHRAFGRRLVGRIGARASVDATVDLFVCKCIAGGWTERSVAALNGMRADYVQGAIIAQHDNFRVRFSTLLRERTSGPRTVRAFRAFAGTLDYVALCTRRGDK